MHCNAMPTGYKPTPASQLAGETRPDAVSAQSHNVERLVQWKIVMAFMGIFSALENSFKGGGATAVASTFIKFLKFFEFLIPNLLERL